MCPTAQPLFVSVVIPVYRGMDSVPALVERLVASLQEQYRLEIILVNDDSPDDSERVCIEVQRRYPETVRFFSLAHNVGEHNAVMAGLNQSCGDWAVIMDDDFQNPVSEVLKLIEYAAGHDCDVVYSFYKNKRHARWRNLGSRFNDKVANLMLKKPHDLYLSSFKILNRFLIDEIVQYKLPYPYIDGLILRTTSKIGRVEVEHQVRRKGRSGYTLTKLVRLWLNMFTNFSILPLRTATVLGALCSLFGMGLGLWTVIEKMNRPDLPVGYPLLLIVVLLFSGIQLLSLGIIGEYVGRIFLSLNRKPQYTIRKRFEGDSAHGRR